MSVRSRLKKLEVQDLPEKEPYGKVIIKFPDGRLYDTYSKMYVTQSEINKMNLGAILYLPDNGRDPGFYP